MDEQDKQLQEKEIERDLTGDVYRYLTEGAYPGGATANSKRGIRLKAKKFSVKDGELYYTNTKRGRGHHKVCISLT